MKGLVFILSLSLLSYLQSDTSPAEVTELQITKSDFSGYELFEHDINDRITVNQAIINSAY